MNNIKILVIEDNPQEAEALANALRQLGYEISNITAELETALDSFYRQPPDIVIADIVLGGKQDGIRFAANVQERPELARPVIFLTGMMDKATFLSAKGTHPVSYLLKPFHILELEFAIELAIEEWAGNSGVLTANTGAALFVAQHFFIKKRDSLVKVALDSIAYLEVSGKYCHIMAREEKFLVQKSLKEMLALLPAQQFIRTHRNYVVHLDRVKALHLADNQVELDSGNSIPISREYKKQFTDTFRVLV